MKKILFPIFAFILFACSSNPLAREPINVTVISQMTVTLTATLTPTSTVTPTPIATFTPMPAFPAEIISAVESALPGYTVYGDGLKDSAGNSVPEIMINQDGTFSRTYEFDGNKNFTVTMKPEDVKPLESGGLDMEGWRYVNGQMLREKYTTADGVNTEKGMDLLSRDEAQAYLANPKNVDLSDDGRKNLRRGFFIRWTTPNTGYLQHKGIVGRIHNGNWGDNIIPVTDGKGGYTVVPTARFVFITMYDKPVTLIDFTGNDKKIKFILVDNGELAKYDGPSSGTPKSLHEVWSGYYSTNDPKFP